MMDDKTMTSMNFQISKAYFKWDFQSWFKSGAKGSVFNTRKETRKRNSYYENSQIKASRKL
jgi:hypothetical protein